MKIESYFERIGFRGEADANLQTLKDVVSAHATSIPFENLDVLAGIPVSLEREQVYDKLVTRRRGGYCFEQNSLLSWALIEIGFSVRFLSARVWYNTPDGQTPPRTHVFLRVDLDGRPWLVDCGVGGATPCDPMHLDLVGEEQRLSLETRRIVLLKDKLVPTFMHQMLLGDRWSDVYEFTGESMPGIDQEMGNWWTSQHPESKFRKNLIVAKLNRDGTRFSVHNREAVHRSGASVLDRIDIASRDQLAELLMVRFQLELPDRVSLSHLFGVGAANRADR